MTHVSRLLSCLEFLAGCKLLSKRSAMVEERQERSLLDFTLTGVQTVIAYNINCRKLIQKFHPLQIRVIIYDVIGRLHEPFPYCKHHLFAYL